MLALEYKARGFQTIKTKVGGRNLNEDIDMLKAIRHSHPSCSLIVDANGGYKASEALEVLKQLHRMLNPQTLIRNILLDDGGVNEVVLCLLYALILFGSQNLS